MSDYRRETYTPDLWVDVPNATQRPPGAPAISGENLRKIAETLSQTLESVHAALYVLDSQDFNANTPSDAYPDAALCYGVAGVTGWGYGGGYLVMKTLDGRRQLLFPENENGMRYRHSLTQSKPAWRPQYVYTVGDLVQPTEPNGRYYRVTNAGTSSQYEPEWPESGTVTGATGVAYEYAGRFWSDWYKVLTTMDSILTNTNVVTGGTRTAAPSATQELFPSYRITPNAEIKRISSTTNVTLTSTPSIEAGSDGQLMTLVNVGQFSITLRQHVAGSASPSFVSLREESLVIQPQKAYSFVYVLSLGQWVRR